MAELALRGVGKTFGPIRALSDVALDVAGGEFCAFIGPAGSGKSMLLRLIAGLDDMTDGTLRIGGEDMTAAPPARRGVAMLWGPDPLHPHMSVAKNLGHALKHGGVPRREIRSRIDAAAALLRLDGLLGRRADGLAPDERLRAVIARAVVGRPRVLLFDEAMARLGPELQAQMRDELTRLHGALGTTLLYVTHDTDAAMALAQRVVVLNRGRVEQAGPPAALYDAPRTRFVAGFIGSPAMNFIETRITEADADTTTVALPGAAPLRCPQRPGPLGPGAAVTLGIRPEHLHAAAAGDAAIPGTVQLVERLGGESFLYVRTEAGASLIARADVAPPLGTRVLVAVAARHCHLFHAGRALAESAKTAPAESSRR